jgi:SAM-dependent methyltransferase
MGEPILSIQKSGKTAVEPYVAAVRKSETLFLAHGDSHCGLSYPKPDGFYDRYRVYFDVVRFGPRIDGDVEILDVGCGTARLLDYIKGVSKTNVRYRGVDMSEHMIAAARNKHPETEFVVGDPFYLEHLWSTPFDYAVFGGLFTQRSYTTDAAMTGYMLRLLRLAFSHCRVGVAFNVMSKHVDWERDDLFHVPFDRMADLVQENLSRCYVFRGDYGLYEYTTYVYREAPK